MKLSKNTIQTISSLALAVFLSAPLAFAAPVFVPSPSINSAPNDNVPAAINISNSPQWKDGFLGLANLSVLGSSSSGKSMFAGKVHVGGFNLKGNAFGEQDLQVSGKTIVGGNPSAPGCSATTCQAKIYYDGSHNLFESSLPLFVNYYSGKDVFFGESIVSPSNVVVSKDTYVRSLAHPWLPGLVNVCANGSGTLFLCPQTPTSTFVLTQLSPNSKAAGSPPFQFDIYGDGFLPSTDFYWETTKLNNVTFINNHHVRVNLPPGVPASLVATAGTYQIQAFNGATASNTLPFSVIQHGARIYYANGTYTGTGCSGVCNGTTFVPPAGVTKLNFMVMWSAGGGGGKGGFGNPTGNGGGSGGGGGGGGGAKTFSNVSVISGSTYTIVVGQGGAAGSGNSTSSIDGGNGGDTEFRKGGTVLYSVDGGEGGSTGYSGSANQSAGGSGASVGYYSGGNGQNGGNGGDCFGGAPGMGGYGGSLSLPSLPTWDNRGGAGGKGGYADGTPWTPCTAESYNNGISDGVAGKDGLLYLAW